jgi:glutamate synthase (NADPH/NADH) small chain
MSTPDSLQREAAALLPTVVDRPLKAKDRLAIPAQAMPHQDPQARGRNFNEVALGYSTEQARIEALRCLQCRTAPCVEGCPVRIDIPGFIKALAAGDDQGAIDIIKRSSLLPAICGRVCPQESQCQEPCTVGKSLKDVDQAVAIGRLERYAADQERKRGITPPMVGAETGRKVAVVGSGPAGLVVAADVRRAGHAVTILEAFHKPGGVMVYGIPEFRLPKAIVQREIDTLVAMGVEVRTDYVVGRTRRLTDLIEQDGYDAVFVGTGAGLPVFMDIPGENLIGVFSANEYLTRVNLMAAWSDGADTPILRSRRVAVLGGGNVAMDAARTALRLGAERVNVVYRRTRAEMPARAEEVVNAQEEGIEFLFLQNAQRILGNDRGQVIGLEVLRYELGAPDDSGRRRPVPIPGSESVIDLDTVIVAIGNNSNPLIERTTPGLATNRWGNLIVDEDGRTSLPRVFAGGDIVLGAATVILAMGQGRRAAQSINRLLAGEAAVP